MSPSPDDVPTKLVDGEKPDLVKTKRDDALAVVALLVGVAIAFLGRKVQIEMVGGIALGLGAAMLAVRGGRPIEGRAWLVLALVLAGFAAMSAGALELYEEWIAGQWLAEGAPTGASPDELHRLHSTLTIARVSCLAGGLVFLLGALVNKLSRKLDGK